MQLTNPFFLATLIYLTASTLALSFPNPFSQPKPALLSLYAPQSGIVPLYRDNSGFFSYIDINSFSSDASDTAPNPQTVPMMLGLYTSKTVFINNCLDFSPYNCTNPICNPFSWVNESKSLPYFTVEGYQADALAFLDYSYWSLWDYALIGTSCTSNASSAYANTRLGVLGLGSGPGANSNYLNIESVSIYLEKDLTQGYLYFGRNRSLYDTGVRSIVLNSEGNWHVYGEGSELRVNNHTLYMNVNVIFDVGSDMMGFPLAIYKRLMKFLAEESISCPDDVYTRPVCNYTGAIEDLPNITLHIQYENIKIVPEIYVQSTANTTVNGSTITLNLRALSPKLSGESYVTEDYRDYIILDMNFMSYYYLTFLGDTVTINVAGPMPAVVPSESDLSSIYIVAGCLGFVVIAIIGGCCYAYRRKKRRVLIPGKTSFFTESLISTENSSQKESPGLDGVIVNDPFE